MSSILKGLQLNELSNKKLGDYKKAAGADATAADKEGDYKRGDKRMSGIIKATKKEFANDEKKEVAEAFNNYHSNRTGFSRGQRDDERHDLDVPRQPSTEQWALKINGKVDGSNIFNSREQALKHRLNLLAKNPELEIGLVTKGGVAEEQLDELSCWSGYHRVAGTKAGFPGSCAKNKTNESEHSESCPHCGGEMVSEELMNEKKDACYYKVKSRYKVWPSAYASGALVKCRNKGAKNWGNGGKKNESIEEDQLDEKWTKKYKDSINCSNPKGFSQKAHCAGKQKNESSILEGINRVDESLHDWFNKEKWVRMDTKGNIKGPCAKEPGEGKPKCLPQSKAHSLGKKGRASAAQRKRREDPNPERSGKAINVNTKKSKG